MRRRFSLSDDPTPRTDHVHIKALESLAFRLTARSELRGGASAQYCTRHATCARAAHEQLLRTGCTYAVPNRSMNIHDYVRIAQGMSCSQRGSGIEQKARELACARSATKATAQEDLSTTSTLL